MKLNLELLEYTSELAKDLTPRQMKRFNKMLLKGISKGKVGKEEIKKIIGCIKRLDFSSFVCYNRQYEKQQQKG